MGEWGEGGEEVQRRRGGGEGVERERGGREREEGWRRREGVEKDKVCCADVWTDGRVEHSAPWGDSSLLQSKHLPFLTAS